MRSEKASSFKDNYYQGLVARVELGSRENKPGILGPIDIQPTDKNTLAENVDPYSSRQRLQLKASGTCARPFAVVTAV